ncbi:MoaD/ThiS family protein [Paenisporosarcina antarctica]|uniref:Molybdopterin synthase sulfur carrier subunit n=1 Tax=Paenisporosarcina antarctica TaxID=417367 RepID=A0A4P6ZXE4_9BACL|nr:MoaD/ThiS family protein [Paenisporosarcina antarctica]QBP41072.1 MoaD/ThiS family protein [Paenisporosarcina antarctica]
MIELHYFAGIRVLTGIPKESVYFSNQTVEDLWKWADEKYPGIRNSSVRIAVNEEYAMPSDIIESGDVVAFIPPVSGG